MQTVIQARIPVSFESLHQLRFAMQVTTSANHDANEKAASLKKRPLHEVNVHQL